MQGEPDGKYETADRAVSICETARSVPFISGPAPWPCAQGVVEARDPPTGAVGVYRRLMHRAFENVGQGEKAVHAP